MKPRLFDGYSETLPAVSRYILAIVLAVVAIGLRAALLPVTAGAKFTTFYPAVILAFYLGGVGPGIASILITAVGAFVFFLTPYNTPPLLNEALGQTMLYLIAAGFCGYFVDRMHQYRRAWPAPMG